MWTRNACSLDVRRCLGGGGSGGGCGGGGGGRFGSRSSYVIY